MHIPINTKKKLNAFHKILRTLEPKIKQLIDTYNEPYIRCCTVDTNKQSLLQGSAPLIGALLYIGINRVYI
jgi:hypothetical protein